MTALTREEREFLRRQSLSEDDVFFEAGLRAKEAQRRAREQGLPLYLGAECKEAHHRLRTRSGHCAQCKPETLAFQERHRSTQWLYIAWSQTSTLFKIGVSADPLKRIRHLNETRYGRENDWYLVAAALVPQAGAVEREILNRFKDFKIYTEYERHGRQIADELYEVHQSDVDEFCDGISEIITSYGPFFQFTRDHTFDFGANEAVELMNSG